MTVFDFDRAIVRQPGRSVVKGLRAGGHDDPDFEGVMREHAAYVDALRAAGVAVTVLPPLEDYPDSIFVEDPALVFGEGAILLRPGAPTRLGESAAMARALAEHLPQVLTLDGDGFADGGDVMVTPAAVFIGLSARTDRAGAEALCAALAKIGRVGRIVETPKGILHFKSASSLLDANTIIATKALAASGVFDGFDIVHTADGEDDAANALRVNDVVFAGSCYPRTIETLQRKGYKVVPLAVDEIRQLDAGLSCMSLRWRAHQQL
jgi:dimethylargininase